MTTPIDTTRLRAPISDNLLQALREMIKWGPHPTTNATAFNALPALLDEVERLRAWQEEAYPRALQAAADVVLDCAAEWRATEQSCEIHEIGDSVEALADRILELTDERIDAFARQRALDHEAATVADHFVCPGCHAVDDEPHSPDCVDAECDVCGHAPDVCRCDHRPRCVDCGSPDHGNHECDDEPEEGGTP